jgi:DeoR family fructose operon transcriptional repressor
VSENRTDSNIYAEERRSAIVRRAREEGRVEVAALAREFGVTPETVRRDLTSLTRHGMLRRVHGGAIPVQRLDYEPNLDARNAQMVDEKHRIAQAALAELPAEGTILIDAGSTTAALADALPRDRALTVVTNSLPIALTLSAHPNLTVLTLGGRVRGRTAAMVDDWAQSRLRELLVDVAFVATNGITLERGLTTPDPAEASTKATMLASARHVVVLADHTKYGQDHFARFGDLADVDVVITDDALAHDDAEQLRAAGPKVVLA